YDSIIWFFFSSRRRHTRFSRDWSSDVCSSDLPMEYLIAVLGEGDPVGLPAVLRIEEADLDLLGMGREEREIRALGIERDAEGIEIGRASCRERVWMWGVAASVKERETRSARIA